jgi:hypothetical protein
MLAKNKPEEMLKVSTDFINDLNLLVSLKPNQILFLADILNKKHEFVFPKEEEIIQEMESKTGLSLKDLRSINNVSQYIVESMIDVNLSFEDTYKFLYRVCKERRLPSISRKKTALKKMFSIPKEFEKKQKYLPYMKGLLKYISAMSITTEARAVFSLEGSGKEVVGYHPVATVKIKISSEKNDDEFITFALNKPLMSGFFDKVKEAKERLDILTDDLKEKNIYVFEK